MMTMHFSIGTALRETQLPPNNITALADRAVSVTILATDMIGAGKITASYLAPMN
jgi:hypothetical protein